MKKMIDYGRKIMTAGLVASMTLAMLGGCGESPAQPSQSRNGMCICTF